MLNRSLLNLHQAFHEEFRAALTPRFVYGGLIFGVVLLLSGYAGLVETYIFPYDAAMIIGFSLRALWLVRRGQALRATQWLFVGLMWAIGFNSPGYGVKSFFVALQLPVIVLSGLLIGRSFQVLMVLLSFMMVPINSYRELIGLQQPPNAVGSAEEWIAINLFWAGVIGLTGLLVHSLANYLEQASASSRGQFVALEAITELLGQDADPAQFLDQILASINEQVQAESAVLYLLDESSGQLRYGAGQVASLNGNGSQEAAGLYPVGQAELLWEELSDGRDWLEIRDLEKDARLLERQELVARGVQLLLICPVQQSGKAIGLVVIAFGRRSAVLPEEIELTKAWLGQIALALQLVELNALTREATLNEERNRMAQEIHDTLAQGFTGIVAQLESALDAFDQGPQEGEDILRPIQRAQQLARQNIEAARRSIYDLRPTEGNKQPFGERFVEMIKAFEELADGSAIQTSIDADLPELGRDEEHHLTRIAQEALQNAIKHSKARQVQVRLAHEAGGLHLEISDNGVGFEEDEARQGYGLIIMRERAQVIGAQLEIDSAPNRGTSILVRKANE